MSRRRRQRTRFPFTGELTSAGSCLRSRLWLARMSAYDDQFRTLTRSAFRLSRHSLRTHGCYLRRGPARFWSRAAIWRARRPATCCSTPRADTSSPSRASPPPTPMAPAAPSHQPSRRNSPRAPPSPQRWSAPRPILPRPCAARHRSKSATGMGPWPTWAAVHRRMIRPSTRAETSPSLRAWTITSLATSRSP